MKREKAIEVAAEALEESDILIKLPCRIGDKIYILEGDDYFIKKVERIIYDGEVKIEVDFSAKSYSPKDFEKTVFLSKEEAKEALEEGLKQ